jgi:hypothetical protein
MDVDNNAKVFFSLEECNRFNKRIQEAYLEAIYKANSGPNKIIIDYR